MLKILGFLLPLVLAVYALVDCAQTDATRVRRIPKVGWILVIALLWVVGPVAWLVAGKDRDDGSGASRWRPGAAGRPGTGQPARQVAPDDNPEFLAQLRRSDEEHQRTLRRWEQDLRGREQESHDEDLPSADGGASEPMRKDGGATGKDGDTARDEPGGSPDDAPGDRPA